MYARASKGLMTWAILMALLLALTGFTLAGCGSDTDETDDDTGTSVTAADNTDDTTSPTAILGAALTLTADDNGKSFTVGMGDTIVIMLEGNPTTGYAWESAMPETDSPLLMMLGAEPTYTPAETGSDVVGGGGTYVFEFQAVAAGQVDLKLKYYRPFEAQAEPLESFSVTLTIE